MLSNQWTVRSRKQTNHYLVCISVILEVFGSKHLEVILEALANKYLGIILEVFWR